MRPLELELGARDSFSKLQNAEQDKRTYRLRRRRYKGRTFYVENYPTAVRSSVMPSIRSLLPALVKEAVLGFPSNWHESDRLRLKGKVRAAMHGSVCIKKFPS